MDFVAVMAKSVAEVASKTMYHAFARAHLQLEKPQGILACSFVVLVISSLEVQEHRSSQSLF